MFPVRRGLLRPSLVVVCASAAASLLYAQNGPSLQVIPVQGNIYMLAGASANIAVQAGADGALVVDADTAAQVPQIAAEIAKLTRGKIQYIINTSADPDHTGGNAALGKLGVPGASPTDTGVATIIAHTNVVNRLSKATGSNLRTNPGLPNDEYFTPTKDLYFNGEPVFVIHEPAAHTDGDSMVLFRRSDVLVTGDIFTPDRFPAIDIERGGSVQGLLDALNHILLLTVPAKLQEGGTRVIPGHGRLCDEAEVVEYRNMVTIVRDRVRAMIRKGMSLEQVKSAKPAFDYETQYGPSDAFTEAVFRSLSNTKTESVSNQRSVL
jgi:cyclase